MSRSRCLLFMAAVLCMGSVAVLAAEKPAGAQTKDKLSDPDAMVRRNTVIALGYERKRSNLPALLKMLGDENVQVRQASANALAITGHASAIDPLIERYMIETDPGVKLNIIIALGDLKGKTAVPLLKSLVKEPYPAFRTEVARALGKINTPESYDTLVEMLGDQAEGVKIMAAQVSGQLGLGKAVPKLIVNLQSPVSAVRTSTVEALGRIGDTAALASLEPLLNDKDQSIVASVKSAIASIQEKNRGKQAPAAEPQAQPGKPEKPR